MTIFELEYRISWSLRKLHVWLGKHLTTPIILRYGSVLLIAWAIFFTSAPVVPPGQGGSGPGGSGGPSATKTQPASGASGPVRRGPAGTLPAQAGLPDFLGKAALVVDATSSAVLFEKNSQEKLPPASLVKLMTALIVLEEKPLSEATTVSLDCAGMEGLKVNLPAGQRFTVEALLKALLLPSAADAACALAESLEGSQASPSASFVARMNRRAETLGLTSTHFVNASGLDDGTSGNYSTTVDLLKLVKEDLKYPKFREIVSQAQQKIVSLNQTVSFELKNTNELLTKDSGFKGIKTGSTPQALGCLAFLYERNGRQVWGVILGSPDRFLDAQNLVKWVFENYVWADK